VNKLNNWNLVLWEVSSVLDSDVNCCEMVMLRLWLCI